jgi:hypothetical protein
VGLVVEFEETLPISAGSLIKKITEAHPDLCIQDIMVLVREELRIQRAAQRDLVKD